MPVRWCAPEVLESRLFSVKSDVWAFGVVLWELFSWGKDPYMGFSNAEVLEKVVGGYRLSPPESMPEPIAELMTACFATEPEKRPSFVVICAKLQQIQEASTQTALIAARYSSTLSLVPANPYNNNK